MVSYGGTRSVDHSFFCTSITRVSVTLISGLEFSIVYFYVLIFFQSKCNRRTKPFLYLFLYSRLFSTNIICQFVISNLALRIESFLLTMIVVNSFSLSSSLKSTNLCLITVLTESLISVLITLTLVRFLSLIFNFFLVSLTYCIKLY